jgi:hypothetical protein
VTEFSIVADDPDNDELTYTWSTDVGAFSSSTSRNATFTAPDIDDVIAHVKVKASDGDKDDSVVRSIIIKTLGK